MIEPLGPNNAQMQRLRRLLGRRSSRLEEGCFVIEGPTLVAEAVSAGWPIEAIYSETSFPDAVPVRSGVLAKVMDVETARPVVAVASRVSLSLVPPGASFVVVAHGISDPGNLGTVLRTAEAAGADAVVCTPGTVDAFSPKVVRSSAGAIVHVPIVECVLADVVGFRRLGTSSHRGTPYLSADLSCPLALVFGNEAHGLPDDAPVDGWLSIPHAGRAESLNVAMAAAILCFAVSTLRAPGHGRRDNR